jgi:hypothetical protein
MVLLRAPLALRSSARPSGASPRIRMDLCCYVPRFCRSLPLTPLLTPPQISFITLHWIKGAPDDSTRSSEYRELTFFEQIDNGITWTRTKKLLMLVPTLLLLAVVVTTNDPRQLVANLLVWMVLILAKLPMLDRVRLFGINSTVGIGEEAFTSSTPTNTSIKRKMPKSK